MIVCGHTRRSVLHLSMEYLFDMRLSVRFRDVLRYVYSRTAELVTQFLHGFRANRVQYFNCRIHGIIIKGGVMMSIFLRLAEWYQMRALKKWQRCGLALFPDVEERSTSAIRRGVQLAKHDTGWTRPGT